MSKKAFHFFALSFLLFTLIYFLQNSFVVFEQEAPQKREAIQEGCNIQKAEKTVRGSSMSPLIGDGETVQVFFNYYDCNEVKRDDIVLYDYAGNDVPLLKQVKGVPGDFFELKEKNGVWNIYINEKIVKNSEEKEYSFSKNRYNMLALYEKNYKEKGIPENTFLILGDSTNPVTDSSRFGFVGKNDIMGKAIKK